MRKLVPFLIIMSLLFTGCSSIKQSKPLTYEGFHMPKEMPDDFAFLVSFGVGSKNIIDTFNGIVIKDLISAGTAMAEVTFTKEEMFSIYQKMEEINVLQPKDLIDDTGCRQEPHGEDAWRIRIDGNEKTIQFSIQYCEITKEGKQLIDLRNFVLDIVKGKEVYKTLPEAEGGYQ